MAAANSDAQNDKGNQDLDFRILKPGSTHSPWGTLCSALVVTQAQPGKLPWTSDTVHLHAASQRLQTVSTPRFHSLLLTEKRDGNWLLIFLSTLFKGDVFTERLCDYLNQLVWQELT